MSQSNLIELTYYDPKANVRLTTYADTIITEPDSKGESIAAVRFGGYPEMWYGPCRTPSTAVGTSRGEIARRLVALEREQNRLFYYMAMLGKRPEQVLRGLYLPGKSQQTLAAEIGVVPRTVRRIRDEAIERLITLYSYAEAVHEDIPG